MAKLPPPSHFSNGNETKQVCIDLPPKINSIGIWGNTSSPSTIFMYSLPLLEVQVVLAFVVTHVVYAILKPLGITLFAAQIFAGLIMGPTVLGNLEVFQDIMFTHSQEREGISLTIESSPQSVDTLAMFGYAVFLFLMGVKMDAKVAFRTARRAVVIGIVSFASPFLVGLAGYWALKIPGSSDKVRVEFLLATTMESCTSFSVIACLLRELKIINSELGRLALSSAAVNTMFGLVFYYIASFLSRWQRSPSWAMAHVGLTAILIILLFCVFRPMMFWIIRTTPDDRSIKEVYIIAIVLAALGSAIFTHLFHNSPYYGVFLCGLAVPDGPPLGSALIDKLECFVNGVFITIYVTSSAMHLDLMHLASNPLIIGISLVFASTAFFVKLISCFIASVQSMMPWRDSLAFGLIMSSKGIVELSNYHLLRDGELISEANFSVLALLVLVNATLVPILVKFLYNPASRKYAGYEKRNLLHLKHNAELRILACIHKPENVSALIHLLDLTFPTEESPIVVYALHLMELIGRDSPIFISHQRQQDRAASSFEHSLPFNQYEKKNCGLVTVNTFTVISPPRLMHEDIISMALDKQTSFAILPFHRKWSMDGFIDAEDNAISDLNCSILDQASCSIGILVDRGMINRRRNPLISSTSYCIGMLFLGGKDDREALTLAKRMARDPRVKLTVTHFVAEQDSKDVTDWDTMLDAVMLKDIKQNEVSEGCDITYIKEVSNNGPQTMKIVKSIADDYDLIIVGRSYGLNRVQTEGLSEWTEFPELGVVGDLLASTDLDSMVSVLVVQQQHYIDVARHSLY